MRVSIDGGTPNIGMFFFVNPKITWMRTGGTLMDWKSPKICRNGQNHGLRMVKKLQ